MKNPPIINNLMHENNIIKKQYNRLLQNNIQLKNENDVLKSGNPIISDIHKKAINILQTKNAELIKKLIDKYTNKNIILDHYNDDNNIKQQLPRQNKQKYIDPYYSPYLYNQYPYLDAQTDYLNYLKDNIDE